MTAIALARPTVWRPDRRLVLPRHEILRPVRHAVRTARQLLFGTIDGQHAARQGLQLEGGEAAPFVNPITRSFVTNNDTDTDGTSFSFASTPLGTATADRRILLGLSGINNNSGIASSVSIAGVPATALVTNQSGVVGAGFYIADVPTGTTGTVSGTFPSTKSRFGIAIWALYGLTSDTPVDFDSAASATSPSTLTISNLTCSVGGYLFAYGAQSSNGTKSWSGAAQDFDDGVGAASEHSGANIKTTAATQSVSLNFGTTGDNRVLLAVSF